MVLNSVTDSSNNSPQILKSAFFFFLDSLYKQSQVDIMFHSAGWIEVEEEIEICLKQKDKSELKTWIQTWLIEFIFFIKTVMRFWNLLGGTSRLNAVIVGNEISDRVSIIGWVCLRLISC